MRSLPRDSFMLCSILLPKALGPQVDIIHMKEKYFRANRFFNSPTDDVFTPQGNWTSK